MYQTVSMCKTDIHKLSYIKRLPNLYKISVHFIQSRDTDMAPSIYLLVRRGELWANTQLRHNMTPHHSKHLWEPPAMSCIRTLAEAGAGIL